jgi:hypothetical protein
MVQCRSGTAVLSAPRKAWHSQRLCPSDFFHSNNDLDAGFRSLTRTPETVYVLELSLDNVRMDGTYHRLKVKLDRDGLDVNARRGYFMPKADENKK